MAVTVYSMVVSLIGTFVPYDINLAFISLVLTISNRAWLETGVFSIVYLK